MSGSGKGGNNRRRSNKRRDRDSNNWQETYPKPGNRLSEKIRFDKDTGTLVERPKWVPVQPSAEPIPTHDCPYCGKPIKDIALALTDKGTGSPVHFDCVMARLAESEALEQGDAVTYIGGGRFGVVHFPNPQDTKHFQIKKILEWEHKENRADWRKTVADHYSVT